jgi:rhamnosyltransferase
MEGSVFLEQIFFVIVLYKRKPEESPAFKAIYSLAIENNQPVSLFVYDNSPEPAEVKLPFVFYRHDPKNSGVSKAYNEAFRVARDLNKKWMLLLDQDTEIQPSLFAAYQHAVSLYPGIKVFVPQIVDTRGIVSPFRLTWGKGFRMKKALPGIYLFRNACIINSGMLIATDAFDTVNGFDEQFPIDMSDIVFTERLRSYYPEFVLINSYCRHTLSSSRESKDLEEDLRRFKVMSNAVKLYKKKSNAFVSPALILLPRGMKLSMKYKTISFIQLAITSMNKGI